MKLTQTAKELYKEICKIEIVDAHEHLPPEKIYLKNEYSGLNYFAGYIRNDLVSAGLSQKFKEGMREPGYRSVSEWWPIIKPYWNMVKDGTYARVARITAKKLYGIDEINDSSIEKLAEAVRNDNTPGLYKRILKDKCNIKTVVSCINRQKVINAYDESNTDNEAPVFKLITRLESPVDLSGQNDNPFHELEQMTGNKISTLDNFVDASIKRLYLLKRISRIVGFKIHVPISLEYDYHTANELFKKIRSGKFETTKTNSSKNIIKYSDNNSLNNYLLARLIGAAGELDLPVAVHTGVWGDFRDKDPKYMIDVALRYPDVKFDVFHLGIPMVRDAAMIGKNFPNVMLNLCWSHIVSQRMTASVLAEILDMVPVNKIIAFGGDYKCSIQKVYGHLVMARETVASVLSERIESGEMSEERALEIAQMWFHENPLRFYCL